MGQRLYISCETNERDRPEVKSLCSWLREKARHCVIEVAPLNGWDFYRCLEEAIDRCDAFVAVVGDGYNSATWLNHELCYADGLRRLRFSPRPRIFAISLDGADLPPCSSHVTVEWLRSPSQFTNVLQPLPPRG